MLIGSSLDGQFTVLKPLGEGSFSTVYRGRQDSTLKPVAIKVLDSDISPLECAKELKALTACCNVPGVPQMLGSGKVGACSYVAMELLGPDVFSLVRKVSRIPIPTVTLIAQQTLRTLKGIHDQGYLHLDIKPDNILLKRKKTSCQCYMVDFGLAMAYMVNGSHYSYNEQGEFRGNAAFASRHMLKRCAPGRRDDLESLVYTWAFMANGTLPWTKGNREALTGNRAALADFKNNTSPGDVCGVLPPQFTEMLSNIRELGFAERPNYFFYASLLSVAGSALDLSPSDLSHWNHLLNSNPSPSTDKLPNFSLSEKLLHKNSTPITDQVDPFKPQNRRTKKRRLTKNMEKLVIVRCAKRFPVVIEKVECAVVQEELTTTEIPFAGRRMEREGTQKREVVATPVLRNKLRDMKFCEAAEWAVNNSS